MGYRAMKIILALFALLVFAVPASAQWQIPNHATAIGKGSGKQGFSSAGPCAAGIPLLGQGTSADPACGPLGNGGMATMPAATIKGNNTGGAANPLDLTATQATAMLNAFTGDSGSGGVKGLVPAPAAGDAAAAKFLSASGSFTTLPAGPPGLVYASAYGVTCDGVTNDGLAMNNFLAAVAASPSKIGVVVGTSSTGVCNMVANQFQIRGGTTIMCSRGVTLKFNLSNFLVVPFGHGSGRTYQGVFKGCTIDGSNVIGSYGVALDDASDWVVSDTGITNVDTGVYIDGATAAYYNRITNVIVYSIRVDGFYLGPNANSNTLVGSRVTSLGQYGIYCRGNQNTFVGMSVETGFSDAFTTDGNCVGATISGLRMENGTNGIRYVSGANYNTASGAYCEALSGTSYIDAGTGNVKSGGNC